MEVESVEGGHLHYLDPQQVLGLQSRLAPVQVVDHLSLRLHREEGGDLAVALEEDVGVGLLVSPSRHCLDTDITLRPDGPQLGRERTVIN